MYINQMKILLGNHSSTLDLSLYILYNNRTSLVWMDFTKLPCLCSYVSQNRFSGSASRFAFVKKLLII